MNHENTRLLLREFNSVVKETDSLYVELARQHGLSDCAFWLLYFLREANDHSTQREIMKHWAMSKQTINSALKGLERDGYITLSPAAEDRRTKHIALTAKGGDLAKTSVDMVFAMEMRALENMGEASRAALIQSNRDYCQCFREEINRSAVQRGGKDIDKP